MKKIIYFVPEPDTCEDLKKLYRKLALKYHPDAGGDTEVMKAVNTEYELLFFLLKDIHRSADGVKYTARESSTEVPEDFIHIINSIIRFENIKIEIVGCFIWVSGQTKPYAEEFKKLSFRWSPNKSAWYHSPSGYRKKSRKEYSMDDLRSMFKTQDIETQPQEKIAV